MFTAVTMSENSSESDLVDSDDCERLLERLSSKGDTILSCFYIMFLKWQSLMIHKIGQ